MNNLADLLESSHDKMIIGVDEVGRGCIAGPVCAGVVVFNQENLKTDTVKSYTDSKKIAESKRPHIAEEIKSNHCFGIGFSSVEEIDQVNIRQATFLAMSRALSDLKNKYNLNFKDFVILTDGRDLIPNLESPFDSLVQYAVVAGDLKVKQISAASILAKVTRDQLMSKLSDQYPEYGFKSHKGYGTEIHRKAIQKWGVLSEHRKTFGGVKEYL